MEWLCRWWIIQNSPVETAVRYYGDRDVMWTSQGMLRLSARAMRRLFQPTLEHIKQLIGNVLNESSLRGTQLLCQSWILCHKMLKIIIIIIIIITRNTFCRTRSLSNATFLFLITWRSSSSKSAAVYKISWKSNDFFTEIWHIGIVSPPYETTHEVSVAGRSCLSISCQSDTQIWRYSYLNFSHIWLEMPQFRPPRRAFLGTLDP